MSELRRKAYVFDMDGTLADSMIAVWGVLPLQFLDERKIQYPNDLLKKVIALGVPGLIRYYKEHFEISETEKEVYEWFLQTGRPYYENTIPAKPFTKELLQKLKKEGASLHVLTGSPHAFLDPWVRRVGLEDLFDNLWSVDDFPINKSNPDLYTQISAKLGVAPEDCVMVDDSNVPLIACKKAGWQAVGIYDVVSKNNEAEMRAIADRYIYSFEELL